MTRYSENVPLESVIHASPSPAHDEPEPTPKGGTATVELRHPQTEAHLCQLAVLENFAENGLYVKFSNEEAEQLEQEALAIALAESAQEASMMSEGDGLTRQSSNLASAPYSKEEAERIAAALMHSEQQAAQPQQRVPQPVPPANKKQSKGGGFKGLFKRKSKDKSTKKEASVVELTSAPPASVASIPSTKVQEPQIQHHCDDILQRTRALRAELQRNLPQYKARNAALEKQSNSLETRLQKEPPTVEAAETLEAARTQVETAEMQLDVIEEGVEELGNLERFVLKTKPAQAQATALTDEVVHQLLACLHHVGVPTKVTLPHYAPGGPAEQQATAALVAHFRENCRLPHPLPLPSILEEDVAEEEAAAMEPPSEPAPQAKKVINHNVKSHRLSPEIQPAAANPPQPVVEVSKPATKEAAPQPTPLPEDTATAAVEPQPAPMTAHSQPVLKVSKPVPVRNEAAPQPTPPPGKAATAAIEPRPPPVTAPSSTSASATSDKQRSAVGQNSASASKQKNEAAPSAAPLDTAAPALKKEFAEQQQLQQKSQQEIEAAVKVEVAKQQQEQQESQQQEPETGQPAVAQPQQSVKEPSPKRKKGFSFFKREKQTEPQAAPLSADAIREAEDSSPPPEPPQQAMQQEAQSAPSTSALQQEAAQSAQKAPLDDSSPSQQPAVVGVLRVPQEDVPPPSAVPPQPAAAAAAATAAAVDDVSGTRAAASTVERSDAAAHAASSEPQSQPSTSPVAEQSRDDGTTSSAVPGSSAAVAIDALPAAKTLPEQDKPILLSPRTPREDKGGAAAAAGGKRVRASSRLRRHMPGKGGDAAADAKAASERIKTNPQIDTLFKELCDALPSSFMMRDLFDAANGSSERDAQASAGLTPQQLELVKADAARYAPLINSLSKDISDFTAPNMTTLVEYVQDTRARLGVIMAEEAAVLAEFPTWPQGKWQSLCEAADAYSELSEYARKEKQWLLQRGSCDEEAQKIEAFVDRVRGRTQALGAKQAAAETRWQLQGIPWDGAVYSAVRANSLHLATLYMSRVLFEVASLEREAALPHEACLRHLAASVRTCHKIHDFAGGFEQDQSELFDKVQRLAKYYLRVMDPSWLVDSAEWATSNP